MVVDVTPILKDIERVLPTAENDNRRKAIEEVRDLLLSIGQPLRSMWDSSPPLRGPKCPPFSEFLEALETLRVCGVIERLPLAVLRQKAAAREAKGGTES